jgi:hypothetical protein
MVRINYNPKPIPKSGISTRKTPVKQIIILAIVGGIVIIAIRRVQQNVTETYPSV